MQFKICYYSKIAVKFIFLRELIFTHFLFSTYGTKTIDYEFPILLMITHFLSIWKTYHPLVMRLYAWNGYLSTFILKWLAQKLNMRNSDWFRIVIQDTRSRSKDVWTIKRPWSFNSRSRTEFFYDSSKSYCNYFLFWVIKLIILIFRVSNNYK